MDYGHTEPLPKGWTNGGSPPTAADCRLDMDGPQSTLSGHSRALLDDLVGEIEDRWRNRQAERLCCLEVDDERIFHRLLHRQIGRLLAPEDTVDVGGRLGVQVDSVEPVGHQTAGAGVLERAD